MGVQSSTSKACHVKIPNFFKESCLVQKNNCIGVLCLLEDNIKVTWCYIIVQDAYRANYCTNKFIYLT